MVAKILYCGSFDPPTLGHLDIIKRAAALFPVLVVAIAENKGKQAKRLDENLQAQLLKKACEELQNVEVIRLEGLAFEYARQNGVTAFLRSLRGEADVAYESALAMSNKQISGIETLFLLSSPHYHHLSSSLIHELASLGHRLHGFVPDCIEEQVYHHLNQRGS